MGYGTAGQGAFWVDDSRLIGLFYGWSHIDWRYVTSSNTLVDVVNSQGERINNATINYACVDAAMNQAGNKGTAGIDSNTRVYQIPTSSEQYAEFFEVEAPGYKPTFARMNLWEYNYNSVENRGKERRITIVLEEEDNPLKNLTLEIPHGNGVVKDNTMEAYLSADDLLTRDEGETINYSQTDERPTVTKHIRDPRFGSEGWNGQKYMHVTGMMPYESTPSLMLATADGSIQLRPEMKYITANAFPFSRNYCLFDFDLTDQIEGDAKFTLKNGTQTLAALPTLHDYDVDLAARDEASRVSLDFDSPDLTKVDDDASAQGVDMKDSGKAFDKFNFQLPPVLPFTVNVERDGDYFIIRACMEKNFLPGVARC